MKLFLRLAGVATILIVAAVVSSAVAAAQTPDVFLSQITSGTRDSFTNGVSGDGRFAVIESTGDIATINPDNADANREIFLLDYGQRRIFQLTRTKSPLLTPTPAPTPTPTPTATPTPGAPSTIEVEVSNNKPVISRDGRWIAFSSNAANPASFDGTTAENRAALIADGNQEMFLYQIPAVPAVDLTAGTDVPLTDLAQGTFTRLTDTAASRPTSPGSSTASPFVAFDNRDPALNDDGSLLAFVSTRNLRGGNANFQPEMFIFNRANGALNQLTTSQGNFVFNESPSFSGDGSTLVFISNATSLNIAGAATLTDTEGNGEIYLVNLTGGTAVAARQVTKTANATNAATVNFLNPGQRVSRNGAYVAFESLANLTGDGAIQTTRAVFIYNVAANTFSQVLARPTTEDVLSFPTFSGDSATLVFSSSRNFTAAGATPATAAEGLNPNRSTQIFSIPVANALNPVSGQTGFERLTNTPAIAAGFALPLAQAFVTDTRNRLMFAYRGELGGGNADVSSEVFYLLTPGAGGTQTPASANAISYQTGATRRAVTASPTAPAVAALAPGMLGIARSTVQVAPPPPTGTIANSSVSGFRPSLPIELNGVSMSINGVAAGLLYVSPDEVQFVVPIGLAPTTGTNTYPVVINSRGDVIRSTLQLLATVPDLFAANGRAQAFNVTNPMAMMFPTEPFTVTSANEKGEIVATKVRLIATGVRFAGTSITVRIKDTDITGTAVAVAATDTPGIDQIDVTLPAALAGAGDATVIVTANGLTSRPADSAPRIQIN